MIGIFEELLKIWKLKVLGALGTEVLIVLGSPGKWI